MISIGWLNNSGLQCISKIKKDKNTITVIQELFDKHAWCQFALFDPFTRIEAVPGKNNYSIDFGTKYWSSNIVENKFTLSIVVENRTDQLKELTLKIFKHVKGASLCL